METHHRTHDGCPPASVLERRIPHDPDFKFAGAHRPVTDVTELKPEIILPALRGAGVEGPLFHSYACIFEFLLAPIENGEEALREAINVLKGVVERDGCDAESIGLTPVPDHSCHRQPIAEGATLA